MAAMRKSLLSESSVGIRLDDCRRGRCEKSRAEARGLENTPKPCVGGAYPFK
jgi:hypothetical protein